MAGTSVRGRRRLRGEAGGSPVVSSISKLKLSSDLAVACSFDSFFRNATKKEAAGVADARSESSASRWLAGTVATDAAMATAVAAQRSWI